MMTPISFFSLQKESGGQEMLSKTTSPANILLGPEKPHNGMQPLPYTHDTHAPITHVHKGMLRGFANPLHLLQRIAKSMTIIEISMNRHGAYKPSIATSSSLRLFV